MTDDHDVLSGDEIAALYAQYVYQGPTSDWPAITADQQAEELGFHLMSVVELVGALHHLGMDAEVTLTIRPGPPADEPAAADDA